MNEQTQVQRRKPSKVCRSPRVKFGIPLDEAVRQRMIEAARKKEREITGRVEERHDNQREQR